MGLDYYCCSHCLNTLNTRKHDYCKLDKVFPPLNHTVPPPLLCPHCAAIFSLLQNHVVSLFFFFFWGGLLPFRCVVQLFSRLFRLTIIAQRHPTMPRSLSPTEVPIRDPYCYRTFASSWRCAREEHAPSIFLTLPTPPTYLPSALVAVGRDGCLRFILVVDSPPPTSQYGAP